MPGVKTYKFIKKSEAFYLKKTPQYAELYVLIISYRNRGHPHCRCSVENKSAASGWLFRL
jgi:hypothetical protein